MAAYTVAQNDDQQWVVTVHGEQILICARKTDAMRAAKEAARLLAVRAAAPRPQGNGDVNLVNCAAISHVALVVAGARARICGTRIDFIDPSRKSKSSTEETMQNTSARMAFALGVVALLALALPGRAPAQGAAPNLSGTYRCQPEPISCQLSGSELHDRTVRHQIGHEERQRRCRPGPVVQQYHAERGRAVEHARRHPARQAHPMVERHGVEQAVGGRNRESSHRIDSASPDRGPASPGILGRTTRSKWCYIFLHHGEQTHERGSG